MNRAATTMIDLAHDALEWLRARPLLVDVAIAVLFTALALGDLAGEGMGDRKHEPDAVGVVLILMGGAALVWRRRAPIPVLTVVIGICGLFYARDYGSFMAAIGLAAFYAVTVHEKNRRRAWLALGIGQVTLISAASVTILAGDDGYHWSNAFSIILTMTTAILAGTIIRNREEIFIDTKARAERAEADRQAEAERAVARERLRIAREMHDVVAHGMSLITVQAAAAQEIALTRPEDAARLMHSVEATGRDALAELRRMLGVLRNDDPADTSVVVGTEPGGSHRGLTPQPTLADLDTTVAHCNEAGIDTELTIIGHRRPLPAGIELAALRIVQEALTNVVKHGGEAATAAVELRYGDDELHLEISDTGLGAASEPSGIDGGHGVMGMRERIEIYGGRLAVGPRSGGGYRVAASLPIGPPALDDRAATPEPIVSGEAAS
jgi:signal transduction histidine kinase